MEEKKPISHVTAGLLISALIVLFSIITTFTGLQNEAGVSLLQYALIIGGIIFFVHQWGKAHGYTKTFGELFTYGFKATTVYTIIFIAFLIIFFLVFPEFKDKLFELSREQMEERGDISEDQIDQAIEVSKKFFWVGLVGGSMFFMVFVGTIASLIGAAVTKKRPNNPFEQQSF